MCGVGCGSSATFHATELIGCACGAVPPHHMLSTRDMGAGPPPTHQREHEDRQDGQRQPQHHHYLREPCLVAVLRVLVLHQDIHTSQLHACIKPNQACMSKWHDRCRHGRSRPALLTSTNVLTTTEIRIRNQLNPAWKVTMCPMSNMRHMLASTFCTASMQPRTTARRPAFSHYCLKS